MRDSNTQAEIDNDRCSRKPVERDPDDMREFFGASFGHIILEIQKDYCVANGLDFIAPEIKL